MATETLSTPPPLSHVLETCLYVRDVGMSAKFYEEVLNIVPFNKSARGAGFALGSTTFLLFQLGGTTADIEDEGGVIPAHGPSPSILPQFLSSEKDVKLRQHFCLAVKTAEEVQRWDAHLQARGVPILSRMDWPKGGKSVYFEDPDGHIAEIGSRGLWPHY
ncbi:Glyoxalase/Bleomycin resistance protein/Dihydroxybiphenyl dioxygenase [Aspergillus alliaceus]|uniref:Glyoxalase/Bleomycin resistance protein/Dihydroxybiphenyl dioxygenase n=1 Tax=Petromyces alliaceus TaxID=209559 RepID=A0A5N6FSP8_PETAA|nr:Glyoxalase/Bleomycin resistance protein/Dihydroxybiphenyl dioxygenase [Aspergillus alliaceus]KAB8232479.1 Glyoxalase/Bleomycin resistance protein/Dihydroxybiphenyl dioxygenase [Aspergillus alliaceus]KAE8393414.1 Glyoxalase/Bleomycin resistance protein/Dihydroxybiphenyl dioxygenase [Aspergillus alliaceus]